MKKIALFLCIVLVFFAVACAQQTVLQGNSVPVKAESSAQKAQQSENVFTASIVSIVSVPVSIEEGIGADITWKVDGSPVTIPSTAILYDTKSHSGKLDIQINPVQAGYQYIVNDFAAGSYKIPNTFKAKIVAPTGAAKIYYRAHAIINGENIWSDEATITVTKAKPAA